MYNFHFSESGHSPLSYSLNAIRQQISASFRANCRYARPRLHPLKEELMPPIHAQSGRRSATELPRCNQNAAKGCSAGGDEDNSTK